MKKKIFVTRRLLKENEERLQSLFEVTLNKDDKIYSPQEIINGSAKHTVFPNEEYQRKSTTYLTNRALTVENNKIPKIIFELIF